MIKKRHAFYKNDAFFVEGLKVVSMALSSGAVIRRLFYTADNVLDVEPIRSAAIEAIEVSWEVIARLSDTQAPQGVVAIAQKDVVPLRGLLLKGAALAVVCDRVKDPGNVGAIIRTADAFGADAVVVLPQTCNPFSPKVVRASAGSIFNLPVVYASAVELVDWVRQRGITLAVTTPHIGMAIDDADLACPLALVAGEEAAGIDPWLLDRATLTVNIPMVGAAESLNVATSVAVSLYEARRQRKEKKGSGSALPSDPSRKGRGEPPQARRSPLDPIMLVP
ncbi:MAG: RNA methyltransferase [Nitrospirae bacterium]|nr:RNA methyltransferase [Candidatus Magnetobacterium casensis]MBF0337306.1 RNA methyltransferase [Nitrospirota bacterium]